MGGSTLPLAPDAYSGRKLGKYEVLCRLSTGGMAEIFLASQRGLAGFRKLVVLKQILPDIKGEEEFVQMFLDEARVTAAFNHPHIAQVFDLDVADGELFLAMEFVPGATLVEVAKACRVANEPIPIGFGLAAARDTALALHYAHTFTDPIGRPTSVIHRDVAEKNIMVTYEGVTKLLDFGIAKNLARKGRTQIGMVKGTSGYMSPEQILGERLDARSDLFSLGVVLHECLTGLRLFHAKTPAEGAGAVLHGQVPPPSHANRAVPPELDAIVLKALSRKREDRYASTLEFARALERAVGPLIWHPEQNGELICRFFDDRREQTRKLLMAERAMSDESSGVVNLSQLIANSLVQLPPQPPQAPQLPPEPETPALPPPAALTPTPRPSLLNMAAVSSPKPPPPPPPEETQARPPTPPRGASSRRLTSTGLPTVTPPESSSLRRPVFEPLPQKRGATSLFVETVSPPPPPPADEATGRTRPGEELTGRTDPRAEEATGRTDPRAEETTGRTGPGGELTGRTDPGNELTGRTGPGNELTGRTDPGNELTGRTDPRADELTGRTDPRPGELTGREEPDAEPDAKDEGYSSEGVTRIAPPPTKPPAASATSDEEVPQAQVRTAFEPVPRGGTRERPARNEEEVPQAQVRTALEPLPRSGTRERPAFESAPRGGTRERPVRMDLMGTIPMAEPPAALRRTPDAEDPQDESPREENTPPTRSRPAAGERFPTRTSNPNMRALRRRAPEPPPTPEPEPAEEDFRRPDYVTSVTRAPNMSAEPASDVSELQAEDKTSVVTTHIAGTPAVERQRGWPMIGVALGVLLLGVLGVALALGWDGGRLLGLGDAPPAEGMGQLQPLTPQGSPGNPATPAPAKATSPTPVPATPADAPATPPKPVEAAAPAPPPAGEPQTPPPPERATVGPTEEEAMAAAQPEGAAPAKTIDVVVDDAQEPSATPKKPARAGTRREEPSASATTGQLTLVTEPYAKAYLGKRYLGQTPIFKLNLPAGKHSLKLVREDGQSHRVSVEIKTGEHTARKIDLDEPSPQ